MCLIWFMTCYNNKQRINRKKIQHLTEHKMEKQLQRIGIKNLFFGIGIALVAVTPLNWLFSWYRPQTPFSINYNSFLAFIGIVFLATSWLIHSRER